MSGGERRLVMASAGSGKTFQLTNELIGLLLAGEEPGAILATTFTRMAAAEILQRTLGRLSAAALEPEALEEVRRFCDPGATHASCAAALERVTRAIDRLAIVTLDSFFSSAARACGPELGLAPGWRMVDEEEEERLASEAADLAIEGADLPEVIELLRALQGDELRQHAHDAVMRVVKAGYAALLESEGAEAAWSAVRATGTALEEAGVLSAVDVVSRAPVALTKQGKPRKRFVEAVARAAAEASSGSWEAFASATLIERVACGELEYDSAAVPGALAEALAPLVEHARHALTSAHASGTLAAHRLLMRYDAALLALKRERGGLGFADPPRLLAPRAASGALDWLYYRLDGRIRHVLLDEFQDTSMTQFRLLEPLLSEILGQDSPGRRVFVVGDVKQSLYAWRQAEPSLIPALSARWPTLQPETLSRSWRSSGAVLEAVNLTFGGLESHPAFLETGKSDEVERVERAAARQAATEWSERFGDHEAAKEIPGCARVTVAAEAEDLADEGGALSGEDANRAALASAVDRVEDARARAPGARIAVILREGKALRTALAMLKARGVPASEARGTALVDAPPVAAAASALRLADHPGDTAARAHVAMTPLGPLLGVASVRDDAAARRASRALRSRLAHEGLAAVVESWRRATASAMDARGAARFERLVEIAEAMDADPASTASDLARVAEERRVEDESGEAAVRVMTIHGSKGLEFDVVVAPMLHPHRAWSPRADGFLIGRDQPLGPVTRVTRYPDRTLRLLHPDLLALHARQTERDVNEELCCAYVAMTRAKRLLEVVVPADEFGRRGEPLPLEKYSLRPAHLVRGALARDEPARPSVPGEAPVELWRSGSIEGWACGIGPRPAAAAREAVEVRVREWRRDSASRLAASAPSRSGHGARFQLRPGGEAARAQGLLVHRWLELIGWIEEGLPGEVELRAMGAEEGAGEDVLERALGAYRAALESEELRAALSRERWLADRGGVEEAVALPERPFAARVGEGERARLVRGRFDRLVVGRAGGRVTCAEVMDFKTDAVAGDANEAAERHRGQLEAYRAAAARQLGIDPARVDASVALIATGRVVRLETA